MNYYFNFSFFFIELLFSSYYINKRFIFTLNYTFLFYAIKLITVEIIKLIIIIIVFKIINVNYFDFLFYNSLYAFLKKDREFQIFFYNYKYI